MAGRLLSGLHGWRRVAVTGAAVAALLSSVFAGALFVSAQSGTQIQVRVFVDTAGDHLLDGVVGGAANPTVGGATVRVWADDGATAGQPDAGDSLVSTLATDASGEATATGLNATQQYWVGIDSGTVSAPSGLNGASLPVAEQTYGPAGSLTDAAGTRSLVDGPVYGGRDPVGADSQPDVVTAAQSIALSATGRTVEFGFSFNVVTNTESNRTQGSLLQFIDNANRITGPNAMRFVPMVPTNGSDGATANWWEITGIAEVVVQDGQTTVDGAAYAPDGARLDTNPGAFSANAGSRVGSRTAVLPVLARPELMIGPRIRAANNGSLNPAGMQVRNAHLGSGSSDSAIEVDGTTTATIPDVVVANVIAGTRGPTDPTRRTGSPGALIDAMDSPGITLENSFLTGGTSVILRLVRTPAAIVRGNEMSDSGTDGFNAESPGMVVQGNRISDAADYCIDALSTGMLFEDNLLTECGDGVGQSGGLRIADGNATIRFNTITRNDGPGVVVAGANSARFRSAGVALISQNAIEENAGLGIDLYGATTNNNLNGDGVTANDAATTADAGNTFIDFPVLTSVAPAGTPGQLTVSGTACTGCRVEVFDARHMAGDNDPVSGLPHGEGARFLGAAVANGTGAFSVNVPATSVSIVTATATNTTAGVTSEFAQNLGLSVLSGRVLVDPNGDGRIDDATPVSGATVRLYRDAASNAPAAEAPDAADPLVATLTTAADGRWTYPGTLGDTFWVTVDSRSIAPAGLNAGANAGQTWAEQTYGPSGSLRADGLGGTESTTVDGPVVGGRLGDRSDDATASTTAEHIFRIDSGTPRTDLDTAFSFNVMSNLRGGDSTDDDAAAGRSVQGSLRQFIQNANAISGPNPMRFVPTTPTNAAGTPNRWWRQIVSVPLPTIVDAGTSVWGEARRFDLPRAAIDPSGGAFAPEITVGRQNTTIARLDTPELELWGDRTSFPSMNGLRFTAPSSEVRGLSMYGFVAAVSVGAGSGGATSVTVRENVLGFDLATRTDPGVSNRNSIGIAVDGGSSVRIRNNAVGWTSRSAIGVVGNSYVIVEANRISEVSKDNVDNDALAVSGDSSGTVSGNWFSASRAFAVDLYLNNAAVELRDNTFENFGNGPTEQGAIRIYGTGSTVVDNHFENGTGPAVFVVGARVINPDPSRPGQQVTIRRNSYDALSAGRVPLAATDLGTPTGFEAPDGPNPNDGVDGCGRSAGSANQGLDHPVVAVQRSGTDWLVTGTACPNSTIDIHTAVAGAVVPMIPAAEVTANGAGLVNATVPLTNPTILAATHVMASQTDTTGASSEFAAVAPITVVSNPPPTVTPPADTTIAEGETVTLTFTYTNTTGRTLTAGPPGVSITTGGALVWTAPVGSAGTSETFTIEATGPGGTASGSVVVSVIAANRPPVVAPIADGVVEIGDDLTTQVVANDPDTPLSYTVLVGPPGLTVDGSGSVRWGNAGPIGTFPVTIRVSDGATPSLSTDVSFTIRVRAPITTQPPPTTQPPVTTQPPQPTTSGPSATTGPPTTTDTTTTTSDPTTTTNSTTTTEPTTTTTVPPTTVAPTTVPDPGSGELDEGEPGRSVVDESVVIVDVPTIDPPSGPDDTTPVLSVGSGLPTLLRAPGSIEIPTSTVGLAGAWIFVLGVPVVLWERKRGVNNVVGIDAGETLPAYATRNSTYPFSFLRSDATMLWSRYRFMGLGEGARVKVESPIGSVWVERAHLRPLHESIERREQ